MTTDDFTSCECGCGNPLTSPLTTHYLPGHDSRHLHDTLRRFTGSTKVVQQVDKLWQMHEDMRAAHECLAELEAYLGSGKFREDPTIQVQDVRNRLTVARLALCEYGEKS